MYSSFYILFGAVIYILLLIDIVKTTISIQGGGWLTNWYSRVFWDLSLKLSGGNPHSKILRHTGYLLLLFMIAIWILLLWLSLFCVLLADHNSIINGTTQLPADAWEKLYYAGFILSTVGVGDYIPSNNFWRIISDIYSFTGLVFVTMSITYLISVLSAVLNQRRLALGLDNLGSSPLNILENGWNGENFNRLVSEASQFSKDIFKHSQNHLAYPVIHYFHSTEKDISIIIQTTQLYEALLILRFGVKQEFQPNFQELRSLFNSINNYINSVQRVRKLRDRGDFPKEINTESFKDKFPVEKIKIDFPEKYQNNRRALKNMLVSDGWKWADIYD